MNLHKSTLTVLFVCGAMVNACSQSSQAPMDVFVGSTPSDDYIKSTMGIADSCEFIKWELTLLPGKEGVSRFLLTAQYGISQPNTNGFKEGGKYIKIDGQWTNTHDNKMNTELYILKSGKISSSIYLIRMDNNIFHFADNHQKLLVGNGGYGYVLNRLK